MNPSIIVYNEPTELSPGVFLRCFTLTYKAQYCGSIAHLDFLHVHSDWELAWMWHAPSHFFTTLVFFITT